MLMSGELQNVKLQGNYIVFGRDVQPPPEELRGVRNEKMQATNERMEVSINEMMEVRNQMM
jgi:hypothetical protein